LKEWAKEVGVDELQLKTTQIYDFENGSPLIPNDHRYSRYLPKGDGTWKLKKKIENKCWRMWQGAVFTWDGRMLPCCFDKDGQHVMGKIGEKVSMKSGKMKLMLNSESNSWTTGPRSTSAKTARSNENRPNLIAMIFLYCME
jgi:hypothetical protein